MAKDLRGVQSQLLPMISTFFLPQVYSFQTSSMSPNSNIPKQTASLNLSMQTEKDVKPLHFILPCQRMGNTFILKNVSKPFSSKYLMFKSSLLSEVFII